MNRAVFLDRDGTINKDIGYLHEIDKFEYIDGVIDGLVQLQKFGYYLIIVTNQSGIARGMFTEKEYLDLEHWIENDLKAHGVEISGSYYCPHLPDAVVPKYRVKCDCRKPACGLFYEAAKDFDIDIDKSIVIGDRKRDLCLCDKSKATGIMINTTSRENIQKPNIHHCTGWAEAIELIKSTINPCTVDYNVEYENMNKHI